MYIPCFGQLQESKYQIIIINANKGPPIFFQTMDLLMLFEEIISLLRFDDPQARTS